jgi:hypothetical protein
MRHGGRNRHDNVHEQLERNQEEKTMTDLRCNAIANRGPYQAHEHEQHDGIQRCGDDQRRRSVPRGIGVRDHEIHDHQALGQETSAADLPRRFFSDCFMEAPCPANASAVPAGGTAV